MIPALAAAYFAAGFAACLAAHLLVLAVRRLARLHRAEAERDRAQRDADDARGRLEIADAALVAHGVRTEEEAENADRPRVVARRIER